MGSFMSSVLDENMKKQQKFMADNQVVMLERNVNMQNAMREKMMATQIARMRELVNWTGSFLILAGVGMTAAALKTRRPQVLSPLIPMIFVVGYQWDMAYNGKMIRITKEAERILQSEHDLLNIALGMPDVAELDRRREVAAKK